ncbi:unnamed protein product, partial [Polarella glacialis]
EASAQSAAAGAGGGTEGTQPAGWFDSQGLTASAASLALLLRERDELHQRLHVTELARCAAEQRRCTTEAALARTLQELESQRNLFDPSPLGSPA